MPSQRRPRQPTASNKSQYAKLASAKPILNEPCMTAPISPRERGGQNSMARLGPAGHSAPMPIPSTARTTNRNAKLGAKPAMELQTEYHTIDIISGALRPIPSARQPE